LDATLFASRFPDIALPDLSLDPVTGAVRVGEEIGDDGQAAAEAGHAIGLQPGVLHGHRPAQRYAGSSPAAFPISRCPICRSIPSPVRCGWVSAIPSHAISRGTRRGMLPLRSVTTGRPPLRLVTR
jgi:hypothetical protein